MTDLEIVVKAESAGAQEAVVQILKRNAVQGCRAKVIHAGVGPVSKSDLLMARTGSRLVLGFNVGVVQGIEALAKEASVEVRLYDVIYKLSRDVEAIENSFEQRSVRENVTGKARVIALFKASHKGTILGCQVLEGMLKTGRPFRVFSAMGPIYEGTIESLHIEKDEVREAKVGRQVGLKISHFKGAKLGDLVECYEVIGMEEPPPWKPTGGVFRYNEAI